MNKRIIIFGAITLVVLAGVYVSFSGGTDSAQQSVAQSNPSSTTINKSTEPSQPAQQQPTELGAYITYSDYTGSKATYDKGKVVYFFNAKWCPTCQALTKDITANISNIPAGITIVSVDYDQYTDLKKQYGVTYQHTLVEVAKNGTQIKKWSGSPTLSALVSKI